MDYKYIDNAVIMYYYTIISLDWGRFKKGSEKMRKLNGTEKQIHWANKIRADLLADCEAELRSVERNLSIAEDYIQNPEKLHKMTDGTEAKMPVGRGTSLKDRYTPRREMILKNRALIEDQEEATWFISNKDMRVAR
jgi:hypothetical protein